MTTYERLEDLWGCQNIWQMGWIRAHEYSNPNPCCQALPRISSCCWAALSACRGRVAGESAYQSRVHFESSFFADGSVLVSWWYYVTFWLVFPLLIGSLYKAWKKVKPEYELSLIIFDYISAKVMRLSDESGKKRVCHSSLEPTLSVINFFLFFFLSVGKYFSIYFFL